MFNFTTLMKQPAIALGVAAMHLLMIPQATIAQAESPEALAAEKALLAVKVDDDPEKVYAAFNEFARTHFGAKADPLIYEKLGNELVFLEDGQWSHVSENSATLAWETNLPAVSYVEYGLTTSYGQQTEPTDRPYFLHIHALTGLETGKTYHYRLVATDEGGNRLVSPDQTLQTRPVPGAVYLRNNPDGSPHKLDKPNTTYILKEDLVAKGPAIMTLRDGITVDLNGYTITYATGDDPKDAHGIVAAGSHNQSKVPYTATDLKIFNGTIRQANSAMVAANTKSEAFNTLMLKGQNIEVAGVRVIYQGPQAWGIQLSHNDGDIHLHHNVIKDLGTKIPNRHGAASRAIGFRLGKSDSNRFRLNHNLIQRARQNGIGGAYYMHNNEIYIDSWSTNSFAIQPVSKEGVDAGEHYNNRIFATGFNPYGFGWAHENLKIHDNLIVMFGMDTSHRWDERWGDVNLLAALRITNYGKGGQVRNNLHYWDNLIIMRAKQGAEVQGTRFFSDETVSGVEFRNNIVKVEILDDKTNKGAAIVVQGHHNKLGSLPIVYRDNRLISNFNIVAFGDSYGKGNNHHFVNCTFERIGNDPRFHTFTFGGAYFNLGHQIIDGKFVGGADPRDVFWTTTGSQSTYAIGWTLDIETRPGAAVRIVDATGETVFEGAASADGTLSVPLVQAEVRPIEWQPDHGPDRGTGVKERDKHKLIDRTPHQVTIEIDGKPVTRTVKMTERQRLEVR